MSYEMPSGQEKSEHYMSLENTLVLLREDERYESLRNNEEALHEKAQELQLILDELAKDPEFASKLDNPEYM